MKFFADENVARAIVAWLRETGHDVRYASEEEPGTEDVDWLKEAQKDERIIITADKDFGELVFREHRNSHGIILMRLENLVVTDRVERLQLAWSVIEANPSGRFIVISELKGRVRRLKKDDDKKG